ncbi:Blue copper protein [Nymphaea thermarum]|nr:Blue copper protein [Nymphaea thermarum]
MATIEMVTNKDVFLYTSALHNVLEVSEADFDGCTQDKVIGMHPVGPTIIPLTKGGNHYFFCGIGTHCDQGLKLSITVGKASAATGPDDDGAPDTSPPADASNSSSAPMLHHFAGVLGLILLPLLFV